MGSGSLIGVDGLYLWLCDDKMKVGTKPANDIYFNSKLILPRPGPEVEPRRAGTTSFSLEESRERS